jgi:hypothetical protein
MTVSSLIRGSTPQAFANFSPGLERSDNPGIGELSNLGNPEGGSSNSEPFQGLVAILILCPRVLATLEPWAEISERLRRISYEFQTSPISTSKPFHRGIKRVCGGYTR